VWLACVRPLLSSTLFCEYVIRSSANMVEPKPIDQRVCSREYKRKRYRLNTIFRIQCNKIQETLLPGVFFRPRALQDPVDVVLSHSDEGNRSWNAVSHVLGMLIDIGFKAPVTLALSNEYIVSGQSYELDLPA
jgi:hypothetical protein